MKSGAWFLGVLLAMFLQTLGIGAEISNNWISHYNVTWTTQSKDSDGSMPCGGGNIGLNVWAEDGQLLFYIASPDAHDEKGLNIKLGRIRITTTPSIFANHFSQELDLASGSVRLEGQTPSGANVKGQLWVDVHQPVVHLKMFCDEPIEYKIAFESWPEIKPRYMAQTTASGLQWTYRLDKNVYDEWRKKTIDGCGMEGLDSKVPDPGCNLVMGGRLIATESVPIDQADGGYMGTPFKGWAVKTNKSVKNLDMRVLVRIAQEDDKTWQAELDKLEKVTAKSKEVDFQKTAAWWEQFWNRSRIVIKPQLSKEQGEKDPNWQAGRNYQLFRYMLGCNSNGKYPTLFNGGFFTVDTPGELKFIEKHPDSRLWESCGFMAQNQRLVYWPMIKSGDGDLIRVNLDFYSDRVEPQQARAKKCWGIDAAVFPEPMDWYGLFFYGLGDPNGHCNRSHLVYHYTSTLDVAYMMLENARFSGDDIRKDLPVIEGVVAYYDQYYCKENKKNTGQELDANDKLVIYPSCAVEAYQGCLNNTDVIAGLQAVIEGLLELPKGVLSEEKKRYYEKFQEILPAIPLAEKNSEKYFAAAESYVTHSLAQNFEFP